MKRIRTQSLLLLFTAAALLLTACAPAALPVPGEIAASPQFTSTPLGKPSPASTAMATHSDAAGNLTEIEASPLPYEPAATHLPPEQWQDWPIVPQIPQRAIVIYQRGLAMDNDPHAFSKVGDCQSIKEVMLGIYDQPGNYLLRDREQYLQETIEHFRGSFDRDGMAVKGGFNAASVLSPLWADPETCLAGETPLECELRIHKPGFVIISLEVWWEGRSVERYEGYMRRIIEYAIQHGTVPILSTKADNVEGDHSINLATARLAYEYDLPLWNFWLAAQSLPNRGLDPERADGFHLSQRAWTERSYTALQTVDALWRAVSSDAPAAPAIANGNELADVASAATLPKNVIPADELQILLSASGEVLVFGLAERQAETYLSPGVFLFDLENQQLHRLLPEGFDLQDVSPDGKTLLVNQGRQLYVLTLDSLEKIPVTDSLLNSPGKAAALWLADGQTIALVSEANGQRRIWLAGYTQHKIASPADWQTLTSAEDSPVALISAGIPGQIIWESGECSPGRSCTGTGFLSSGLDGKNTTALQAASRPYLSSPAGSYAYGTENSSLMVHGLDGSLRRELPLPGNAKWEYTLADAAWSADGQRLALQVLERSNYTGKRFNATNYILTPANWGIQELGESTGLNPFILWAPDETGLILAGTTAIENNGYAISLSRLAMPRRILISYDEDLGITAPEYLFITRLGWMAPKK